MGEGHSPAYDRRRAIKAIGTAGAGLVGVSSLPTIGDANPTVCSVNGKGNGPSPAACGGGGSSGFAMNVTLVERYVTEEEVCMLLAAGCFIGTVALAVNTIPYDAVVFARACGSGVAGCEVWSVFSDKHGDRPADVFRAEESAEQFDVDDYFMVPSAWNWDA